MAVFRLRYGDDNCCDAPAWLVDWVRLGVLAAKWCGREGAARRTVAIAAPTQDIAAAAVALGFVRASYLDGIRAEALLPIELDRLVPQQRIWFRAGPTARTGRFLGAGDRGVIRTSNGHFHREKIEEVRALPDWFPEVESRADVGTEAHTFLAQVLRAQDAVQFATSWSTRLLVIGSVARLAEELDLEISAAADDGIFGKIRQIVRPFDADVPSGCQSVMCSPRTEVPVWQRWAVPPALTVLRGAYATSRWLPDVTSRCTISILGRAEPGLDGAVAALMQARAYGDPVPQASLGWKPPAGCEVLAYEEPA